MAVFKKKIKPAHFMRILGLIIFVYILSGIDWRESLVLFNGSNHIVLIAAFLLNIPIFFLKSYRWKVLVGRQNHRLKTGDAMLYHLCSSYLGFITPGRVGEFVKAFYLSEAKICTVSQGFAGVFIDRVHDLYLFVMLGTWGLILYFPGPYFAYFGWGLLVFLSVFPPLVLNIPRLKRWLNLFIAKIVYSRLFSFSKLNAVEFKDDFEKLIDNRLFLTFCITAAASGLVFFQINIIMSAVHIPLTYLEIIPVIALAELIGLLPISIAGLGTREAVLFYCLIPLGISKEQIILASVGVFLIAFVGMAFLGGIAWWKKPVSLPRFTRQKKEDATYYRRKK